jgi:hypothetical protein
MDSEQHRRLAAGTKAVVDEHDLSQMHPKFHRRDAMKEGEMRYPPPPPAMELLDVPPPPPAEPQTEFQNLLEEQKIANENFGRLAQQSQQRKDEFRQQVDAGMTFTQQPAAVPVPQPPQPNLQLQFEDAQQLPPQATQARDDEEMVQATPLEVPAAHLPADVEMMKPGQAPFSGSPGDDRDGPGDEPDLDFDMPQAHPILQDPIPSMPIQPTVNAPSIPLPEVQHVTHKPVFKGRGPDLRGLAIGSQHHPDLGDDSPLEKMERASMLRHGAIAARDIPVPGDKERSDAAQIVKNEYVKKVANINSGRGTVKHKRKLINALKREYHQQIGSIRQQFRKLPGLRPGVDVRTQKSQADVVKQMAQAKTPEKTATQKKRAQEVKDWVAGKGESPTAIMRQRPRPKAAVRFSEPSPTINAPGLVATGQATLPPLPGSPKVQAPTTITVVPPRVPRQRRVRFDTRPPPRQQDTLSEGGMSPSPGSQSPDLNIDDDAESGRDESQFERGARQAQEEAMRVMRGRDRRPERQPPRQPRQRRREREREREHTAIGQGYVPRINPQPVFIQGPAGPAGAAGAPGAAGASSSSSSASAGGNSGRGGDGMRQAQAIIVNRGRRRRKPSSELTKLRKEYIGLRKVAFKTVIKSKKERVKAYQEKVKTDPNKKKLLSEYRKAIKARHDAYKKGFPAGTKIKEVATLRQLISKLKKPTF